MDPSRVEARSSQRNFLQRSLRETSTAPPVFDCLEQPTMTMSTTRRPDLDHCVETLQSLSHELSSKDPKTVGEIYLAAVGLLFHLKVDQSHLRDVRKQHEGKDVTPCPPPNATPAITVVIHNQALFRSLLSCISCSSGDETESRPHHHHHHHQPAGRKRAGSFAEVPESSASKSLKLAHSPQISKRTFSYSKPQFNVKIVAATILYTAFEHIDHWPVLLVKAYAEDCFGPRSWVDEPACQLLVENLALSHGGDHATEDEEKAADALVVAEFYRTQESTDGSAWNHGSPVRQSQRRGSMSSISSQLSLAAPPLTARARATSIGSVDILKPSKAIKSVSTGEGHDSDSGDDEEVEISPKVDRKSENDDGSSSSSGEEDEEVVVPTKSFDGEDIPRSSPSSKVPSSTSPKKPVQQTLTYPIVQENLNLIRIRQRYFGLNLEYAHLAVSSSLSDRLDVKSKQNSGLLQTLPSFTSIPSVRSLITGNLEKWLQSPALSGLARSLFSRTVNMMKKIDPPLPADLEAIDNILSMRLKANQLNAHIENVTAIATRIPTAAVSHHIYIHLLREVLLSMETADVITSDHLKMIGAVHGALPSSLSAEGIAASLLTLLVNQQSPSGQAHGGQLVKKLRALIRAIAKELGSSFDGCQLLQSILSFDVSSKSWNVHDEENKARLMFQCVTLLAASPAIADRSQPIQPNKTPLSSDEDAASLKNNLTRARKLLLSWCCADYAPLCFEKEQDEQSNGKKRHKDDDIAGAGIPDYNSILNGLKQNKIPRWLEVMRSVLFMESAESPAMQRFISPDGSKIESEAGWQEESKRIGQCCELGADLDDEMVWIVLKTASLKEGGTPAEVALPLLENLFECCKKNRKSSLRVTDPKLLWELYNLVEYTPQKRPGQRKRDDEHDDSEMEDSSSGHGKPAGTKNGIISHEKKKSEIPRLAFPGRWWRVTGLALILCGSSPEYIGTVAWEEHPTLRALIKMVTSDRYRFPTVDCDDSARDEMKKTEQAMRDEEARVTELLFFQKKPNKKRETEIDSIYNGSRVSKRQRDKRELLVKKQQEKQAAEALAEANRRKKMLRTAQKSIMLWDPKKGPRKPPRESADLIFSVGELFGLPQIFQRSLKPDFVLKTIGQTTRGAIERAYDWLIPIISFLPETIARLPASASCFLLLRAYGTEGEERAQLQELSGPLLVHVRQSLKGEFGEADALRAFDLLLTDVASHNPDRRRCARRVLHDAIGKNEHFVGDARFEKSNSSWMINMLYVEHVKSILSDAIKYMSRAATFERGKTLRSLVLALQRHMTFAQEEKIPGTWDFPSMLIGLISTRPTVFAAAMGTFPDLRSRAIRVVHDEFDMYIHNSLTKTAVDVEAAIAITLRHSLSPDSESALVEVTLPLALLQSASVLLSIWLGDDDIVDADTMSKTNGKADGAAVADLVRLLMRPQEFQNDIESEKAELLDGLASARIAGSGKNAVPVESWVMLARSRSDFIAKRAALTAPTGFLPRLLMCSGLPRASLFTMIDRLGKLGDKASNRGKTYSQLLVPSAASEWDIGRLGHRREVSRKLLGRLSAYTRMYAVSIPATEKVSFTFLEWLSESCKGNEKSRKPKPKKLKASPASSLPSIGAASSIFAKLSEELVEFPQHAEVRLDGDASDMTKFRTCSDTEGILLPARGGSIANIREFVEEVFSKNEPDVLEAWLSERFPDEVLPRKAKKRRLEDTAEKLGGIELSLLLLQSYLKMQRRAEALTSSILKWVPRLSTSSGSPELWSVMFAEGDSQSSVVWGSLLSRCIRCWCHSHTSQCRDWILSQASVGNLNVEHVVRFLVISSSQASVHVETFAALASVREDIEWGRSEEFVSAATGLALDCLQQEPFDEIKTSLCSRNNPPDSVILLLLLARCGRKQLQFVCQTIVQRIEKGGDDTRKVLLAVILRMYAYFPLSMNLGVAILRSVLKAAVEEYPEDWLVWRSPLDDQFQDMIESVIANSAPARLVQALSEGSKKHPLMILRKLDFMEQCLEADAAVCEESAANDKRGIIFGQNLSGPQLAKIDGKLLKVTVKHWGFNFTESLWLGLLDLISSVPREVLFGCGLKMRLLDFLGVYLRLFFVQTQLRTSDKLSRLKGKLSEFFQAFQASNTDGWDRWLATETSGLTSLGGTRNVLMSCDFITHQQAIDNVKEAREATQTSPDNSR